MKAVGTSNKRQLSLLKCVPGSVPQFASVYCRERLADTQVSVTVCVLRRIESVINLDILQKKVLSVMRTVFFQSKRLIYNRLKRKVFTKEALRTFCLSYLKYLPRKHLEHFVCPI